MNAFFRQQGYTVIASFNMGRIGARADDRIGHVAPLVTEYFDGSH